MGDWGQGNRLKPVKIQVVTEWTAYRSAALLPSKYWPRQLVHAVAWGHLRVGIGTSRGTF